MARVIEYYRMPDGSCPVEDFLAALTAKEQAKVFWVLDLLETMDRVPREYFKKLENTEEIWEVRIQTSGKAYRVFSFFFVDNMVVLTNGYSKKSQKVDRKEISRAEKYRREHINRYGG